MLASEKLAIAAHLHVLLRRKTGRVTDTEWMAGNLEYATEIVRFARRSAAEDGHVDLAEWAGKLEQAMIPAPAPRAKEMVRVQGPSTVMPTLRSLLATNASHAEAVDTQGDGTRDYVRGLR